MDHTGTKPENVEFGNAWEMRSPEIPYTNWFIGEFQTISKTSLQFMRQSKPDQKVEGAIARDIAVKWFLHSPEDPKEWGHNKQTSEGRTMSILVADGEFELNFTTDDHKFTLVLNSPGDFAIWGPGLQHSWKPIKASTILTLRWVPL